MKISLEEVMKIDFELIEEDCCDMEQLHYMKDIIEILREEVRRLEFHNNKLLSYHGC